MKTYIECLKKYGSNYFIAKSLKDRELFKIEKGIYSEKEYVPALAIYTFKYPNAVVTMESAFFIHGLMDIEPDKCTLATTRNASKITDPRIKQYFIPGHFFYHGIETANYNGYKINIYNKERMLVELVRYKSKLPPDHYKKFVYYYRKMIPKLDTKKILEYALAAPKKNMILNILQTEVL